VGARLGSVQSLLDHASPEATSESPQCGHGIQPLKRQPFRTRSLDRSNILRRWAVGVVNTIESAIAINAAERTHSDRAEEIPLHGAAPMRPKYLGTTAMWTVPLGVRFHF
jgi:hypothetical protein